MSAETHNLAVDKVLNRAGYATTSTEPAQLRSIHSTSNTAPDPSTPATRPVETSRYPDAKPAGRAVGPHRAH
ncbi:uncharacterized protein LAESUDRAFT_529210 [Laetiporus sulphureus 93-53]|uniref:Uncharacterized protein n=1 Tax=Laetiporus sulphureus 93-53 TaxID=1314785 RepID=A0A165BBY2_9APHY|nr:uncharacterized protein LAESUDRAFT_529210 [Laetiporus sulphureus 93-53]KZT00703.1 hypothetical protein LAESUDRAFT_529210 [Laetiporus sulphureus 93-53]